MQIRHERPSDAAAIHVLTEAAFQDMAYSSRTEARIVDALRAAGALTLSLVAEADGEIVGHAAFSPVAIDGVHGGWHGLGPVSVRPGLQRGGIGSAVIFEGLRRLEAMGSAGCVVLGHPGYYGRFGFEIDPRLRYGDASPSHFRRRVFSGPEPTGEVSFHPAFDVA